jgi:hypothetical protein
MTDRPSLAGPLARIDRADELVVELGAALKAFLQTRPYSVEEQPDANPATRAFVVTSLRDIPARPRIIAGEIAHHLRAALDLLAYQLLLEAAVTDDKVLRKCSFPILDHDLSNPKGKGDYDAAIHRAIGPLPTPIKDRIEAVQPCVTNHEWSHLAQVQALNNTDKHRLLLAATSSIRIGGWNFRDEHGNVTIMPHHSFAPLQVDTMLKVGDAPSGFVLPNLAHEVCFMEPGPVFGHPMHHNLRNLSQMTRQTVLSFADCF